MRPTFRFEMLDGLPLQPWTFMWRRGLGPAGFALETDTLALFFFFIRGLAVCAVQLLLPMLAPYRQMSARVFAPFRSGLDFIFCRSLDIGTVTALRCSVAKAGQRSRSTCKSHWQNYCSEHGNFGRPLYFQVLAVPEFPYS